MFLRLSIIFILILSSFTYSFSQVKDTVSLTTHKSDSVKRHSPKKAAMLSTILPGAGQVYNKKYWKVPVLYAGIFGLSYYFGINQTKYVKYRNAYKYAVDGDSTTINPYQGTYSNSTLNDMQQLFHRHRDMGIIGLGLLYIINVVDASVDGHLFNFDVSDNLSMKISPQVIYMASNNQYRTGISLNFNFK